MFIFPNKHRISFANYYEFLKDGIKPVKFMNDCHLCSVWASIRNEGMSLDLSESSFTSLPGGCEAVEGAGRAQSEDLLSGLWEAG